MSTIPTTTNESVWKLYQFLGLNENPDGDCKLKMGEATVCRNWKVTRDRNLKKRPGYRRLPYTSGASFDPTKLKNIWFGNVNGTEIGLISGRSKIYKIYENGSFLTTPVEIGSTYESSVWPFETAIRVTFFPYNNIVYILDGHDYYKYDGTTYSSVTGYVPLVVISRAPNGADGQTLEEVNKLNGKRRVWFSPDGTSTVFQLPETGLSSIDTVTNTSDGSTISGVTKSKANGTVTFSTAPERGINTIEISYTVSTSDRSTVVGMTLAELYLGAQDDAVFLYGDGTNKAIYSGVDYDGNPSAEYFPDLNVITVADANTPITDMIRLNNRLMCYKKTSTYNISFGLITLADGNMKYGFYVTPVNKEIGNCAYGQVRLVNNAPITLHEHDLYRWENTSPYSAEITRDERMAIRMSDRVFNTLGKFDLSNCYCFDDNANQEYYIWCWANGVGGIGVVYNYAADAWYTYTTPPNAGSVTCMANIHGDVVVGTEGGAIYILDSGQFYDDYNVEDVNPKQVIDCYWESGSIDFGKPYMRKFISELWVGTKPEEYSSVTITIMTDKKSEYTERTIRNSLATFLHTNFADFSFRTNWKPQIKKLKIKAKKFAFLKLVLKTQSVDDGATVLMVDPKIRETGYVK